MMVVRAGFGAVAVACLVRTDDLGLQWLERYRVVRPSG